MPETITDYSTLIDAETWAFIDRTNAHYPPDAVDRSIAEQRQVYDTMCREFFMGYPDGVVAGDLDLGGVPCRRYEVPGPMPATVVYYHGGGFVVGGLHSHDDVCAEIAAATGFRLIAVDYRLAPEHRHPAAFDDSLAALRAVAARYGAAAGGRIVLAGDSAGGNLAAAVAHATRAEAPGIAGQVLVYPGLGGDRGAPSYTLHAEAPMLTRADIEFYGKVRYRDGREPVGDPTAAPLQDRDFSGLPPTLVISAQCDPLASDGPAYAARLRAAGVPAEAVEEAGLVHGYLRARSTVARAGASFARITAAIAAMGRGDWRPASAE